MTDNIEILVKLFETLRSSTDKNEETTRQLVVQQLELVNQIKHLPIDDLRKALAEHAKEAAKDVNACTEVVSLTSSDVMKELRAIRGKLTKMLIALGLVITISTTGYFIIRTLSDNDSLIEKHLEKKFDDLASKITKERANDIEKIREEMRELHNETLHKDGAMQ